MIRAVDDVLHEIDADQAPRLLVLAKVDRLSDERRAQLSHRHPGAVQVSAVSGEGLDLLVERIESEFTTRLAEVELLVPYQDGGSLAELHELAGDLEREDTPDGVRVSVRLPAAVAARFERFALTPETADRMTLRVVRLDPRATLPARAHPGRRRTRSACAGRRPRSRPASAPRFRPGSRSRSSPGTPGWCCPRSGLAARHGISVVNAPGLIDSGYRGELRVLLLNTDRSEPFELHAGDRIAQLVLIAVAVAEPVEVSQLSESERGAGGFGSSGR